LIVENWKSGNPDERSEMLLLVFKETEHP